MTPEQFVQLMKESRDRDSDRGKIIDDAMGNSTIRGIRRFPVPSPLIEGENLPYAISRMRKDTNRMPKEILAHLVALEALVTQVVGNDPGNSLTEEQVRTIVENAIRDNVVQVDVTIQGEGDEPVE